jgi:hypothetical protein
VYLKNVFVRFYKSFNFDYLRKYDQKVQTQQHWEKMDDLWYPYVRIPIDEKITTIVGANESGKTHLLTAIEKGLSGTGIVREDFCRNSQFFTVEQGQMRWPDFGFEWAGLSREEHDTVAEACGIDKPGAFDRFLVFRTNRTTLTVYIPANSGYTSHSVAKPDLLLPILPSVFRLRENVAVPESVPIRFLAGDSQASTGIETLPRKDRVSLFDSIWDHLGWFATKETVVTSAAEIASGMSGFRTSKTLSGNRLAELDLAKDLICKVARIDSEALKELYEALRDGRDAFANSVIDEINDALQAKLNFPQWWVQDRQFRLLVSPREYDLVFTIRDRTEREYSFGERSSGLRYFLSYYIQYLAHDHPKDRREILLMDEPDAFLSNQGQQDLLKIFDAFASPEDGSTPIQLIYVTHSPFLIDRNHGERVRVLEKGVGEEGTRVVRDASRNHYEPLRSAFGSFVGETTFIGNCNLIVEGPADQILLAAAAAYLRAARAPDVETLDLNHITIVPASGASHIPYLVYLARGRDIEKPAIIVMLDSDSAGNDAKKGILRGGPHRKELLKAKYILQLGELSKPGGIVGATNLPLVETEDLIPMAICLEATKQYLRQVCAAEDVIVQQVTSAAITAEALDKGIFKAIEACLKKIDPELHIEKIGFARTVIEVVADLAGRSKQDPETAVLQEYETRMRFLFRRLRQMQRDAERELTSERVSARVNRSKDSFITDRAAGAKREHAFVLFEEIEAALDNSEEADQIKLELQAMRRDFKIDEDLTEPIDNFQQFRERLEGMRYAGRLATQNATLQEVTASTANAGPTSFEPVGPENTATTAAPSVDKPPDVVKPEPAVGAAPLV